MKRRSAGDPITGASSFISLFESALPPDHVEVVAAVATHWIVDANDGGVIVVAAPLLHDGHLAAAPRVAKLHGLVAGHQRRAIELRLHVARAVAAQRAVVNVALANADL